MPTSLSACFVGETTLPIKCAEHWISRGHTVVAIVTDTELVARWARDQGIRVIASSTVWRDALAHETFDYLVSIFSLQLIDDVTLARARRLAVNLHDGPLPRYAGRHVSFWAVAAGEREHGVTWHVMSRKTDAGDILRQRRFAVTHEDTAYSLSTKSYAAGLESFVELTAALGEGTDTHHPQDTSARSYFSSTRRPAGACVLDVTAPAEVSDALVRALTFGPMDNPIGSSKLMLPGATIAVLRAEVLAASSHTGLGPGTIVEMTDARLVIATSTTDLAIKRLATLSGDPIPLAEVGARFGLRVGMRVPARHENMLATCAALAPEAAKQEAQWVKLLERSEPVSLPYAATTSTRTGQMQRIAQPVPTRAGDDASHTIAAEWIAYLLRLGGSDEIALAFTDPFVRARVDGVESLFMDSVLVIVTASHAPTRSFVSELRTRLQNAHLGGALATDVVPRYRALTPRRGRDVSSNVRIDITHDLATVTLRRGEDLVLGIASDGTEVAWVFDAGVYTHDGIARMCEQFERFVDSVARAPDDPVGRQRILDDAELRRILVDWNATKVATEPLCLHQLFERQVDRTPDASALVWLDERVSYQDLDVRANRVANHLRAIGVGPDVIVGMCLERCTELLVVLLGILKAGAAYLPLDPAYPGERLRYTLDDSGARLLITQSHLRSLFDDLALRPVITVDGDADVIASAPAERPDVDVGVDHLAYLMYTSGSTGRPKGVAVHHRGPATLVDFAHTLFSPEDLAGGALLTSVCFDISVWEIFLPLSCGGKLVLARNALHMEELPARDEITFINTVPSVMKELLARQLVSRQLRLVSLGGEPVPAEIVNSLYDRTPVQRVFDFYGPTETSVWSSCAHRERGGRVTVGHPTANTQIYVLDHHDQPVPAGVPGHVHIGGDGVARGYHGRGALTAERFAVNPFADTAGARMYRTGDLGRFYPDGALEILGRIDHQVKIRGLRIELGEIEAVLRGCAGIEDCVVVVATSSTEDKRLVAYVAPATTSPNSRELRNTLAQRLPYYMVPAAYVYLDALPRTPNGKIDRRALPPADSSDDTSRRIREPHDPLEATLATLWRESLRVTRVSTDDDYFALGGNSLSSVSLMARIESTFGVKLGMAVLSTAPTILELAALLRRQPRTADVVAGSAPQIERRGSTEGPAANLQPYFYAVYEHIPREFPTVVTDVWRFEGPLDLERLRVALADVHARHEVLRTRYRKAGDAVWQIVTPPSPARMSDLEVLESTEADLGSAIDALSAAGVSPERGPVFRLGAVRLSPTDHALVLQRSHIAFDGRSEVILRTELEALYGGQSLPPLPFQFMDVAEYLHAYARSAAGQTDLDYWTRRLDGVEGVELPIDHPRDAIEAARTRALEATGMKYVEHREFGGVTATADADETRRMLDIVTASRISPLALLTAGLATMLHHETGQSDIVIQTSLDIRPLLGADPLIGGFNTPVYLRLNVAQARGGRALLDAAHQAISDAYTHALGSPVQAPPAAAGRINLGYVSGGARTFRLGDANGAPMSPTPRAMPFDLRPWITIEDGVLRIGLGYSVELFFAATARRMCDGLLQALRELTR